MKAWFWCPCCQRAFQEEVPQPKRSRRGEWLGTLGVSETFTVACPFADCRATARCIMTWPVVRKWAEIAYGVGLPPVPIHGQAYGMPPAQPAAG